MGLFTPALYCVPNLEWFPRDPSVRNVILECKKDVLLSLFFPHVMVLYIYRNRVRFSPRPRGTFFLPPPATDGSRLRGLREGAVLQAACVRVCVCEGVAPPSPSPSPLLPLLLWHQSRLRHLPPSAPTCSYSMLPSALPLPLTFPSPLIALTPTLAAPSSYNYFPFPLFPSSYPRFLFLSLPLSPTTFSIRFIPSYNNFPSFPLSSPPFYNPSPPSPLLMCVNVRQGTFPLLCSFLFSPLF